MNTMSGIKLKKMFGATFEQVLCVNNIIRREDKTKKGQKASFLIVKDLPTMAEYAKMKKDEYTTTVFNLVSDACSEFDSLKEELQEWYDNLPQSFQEGDKGSQLQEAIDNLENIQEPDMPSVAIDLAGYFEPWAKCTSRSDRCSQAGAMISAAQEICENRLAELEMARAEQPNETDEDEIDELQALVDELSEIASNAECVEFPTMYS